MLLKTPRIMQHEETKEFATHIGYAYNNKGGMLPLLVVEPGKIIIVEDDFEYWNTVHTVYIPEV